MRSALVNNRTFSTLAVKYNYHNHIKFRDLRLYTMIDQFVEDVKESGLDVLPLADDMVCNSRMFTVVTKNEKKFCFFFFSVSVSMIFP